MTKQVLDFSLGQYEYIALCDLLKLTGVVDSGGQAKVLITEGYILRNGEVETRKTAKIRANECIELDGMVINVRE
ncbi:RNA-binding S4 domain-containing protein [Pelistega ratti]|uniref:RNA-binding S4 domain-containing protein n=1 Tax=Pelistega ratti TaxID=2652177 RepID=UPI001359453D|nr:RNA-binding S4 domain-containing protein [Pelistega ratti]